ncbi:hypothetical protein [Prescottella agglutinans]|uniref:hypothetical protein n=1 Tax=Prescottella agglutinans TaxID=1644129 RepID=UPI003D99D136
MGSDSRYEASEVDLWERLAALLPSIEGTDSFRNCRESGHEEAGLWMLTLARVDGRERPPRLTRAGQFGMPVAVPGVDLLAQGRPPFFVARLCAERYSASPEPIERFT